jgi:hypothetical protein
VWSIVYLSSFGSADKKHADISDHADIKKPVFDNIIPSGKKALITQPAIDVNHFPAFLVQKVMVPLEESTSLFPNFLHYLPKML